MERLAGKAVYLYYAIVKTVDTKLLCKEEKKETPQLRQAFKSIFNLRRLRQPFCKYSDSANLPDPSTASSSAHKSRENQ
ncbi:hypothetical protein [Absidia glauca]|uniref:Uncharacterized protein n=1 Tax=Absidia glauca TaxID=4829 RepID=A0A163LT10_ABSGL|nr:hypothetical protein [Absidia glauca]